MLKATRVLRGEEETTARLRNFVAKACALPALQGLVGGARLRRQSESNRMTVGNALAGRTNDQVEIVLCFTHPQ